MNDIRFATPTVLRRTLQTFFLTYGTLFVGIAIITYLYYTAIDTYGIPLGWDTASYLAEAKVFKLYGFSRLLSNYNGQSFLIALVLGLIDVLGGDTIAVAMWLPYVIIVAIMILSYKIARIDSTWSGLLVPCFLVHWFTLIRFASDLYRSLTSLMFFLLILSYYPDFTRCKIRSRHTIMILIVLLLMSLTQIEFSLLTTIVIILAMVLQTIFGSSQDRLVINLTGLFKMSILTSIIVFPAFILAISYSTYFLALSYPVELPIPLTQEVLNNFYLFLLPLTTYGIIVCIRKASPIHLCLISLTFITILGIFLGCLPFYTPFRKFAPRLSYLFPMPFLCSIALASFLEHLEKFKLRIILRDSRMRSCTKIRISNLLIFVMIMAVLFAPLSQTIQNTNIYWRPFISIEVFNNLKAIASNSNASSIPVFVIYAHDVTPYMYNNWITAIVGKHFTYLGSIDNFLALIPTNFTDRYATEWSIFFLKELTQAGLKDLQTLSSHPIYLLTGMYNRPISEDELAILNKVAPGLYSLNLSAAFHHSKDFTIIAATDFSTITSGFYVSYNETWPWPNWQTYNRTLKLYVESPDPTSDYKVSFLKFITVPGWYNVSIRYLDACDKCVIRVMLNNSVVASFDYMCTLRPVERSFGVFLNEGYVNVTIKVEGHERLYLNLDYIRFSLSNYTLTSSHQHLR